jgi:hypothetical protein
VPADLGSDGFEPLTQLVDLDDEARQGVRLPAVDASLLDDGPQFGAAVEGRLGHPGVSRDGGEGDGRAGMALPPKTGQIPTLLLDDPVTARTLREVRTRENCAIDGYCTT